MKNKLFDIFSGLGLALPLAVMAGAVPMAVDSNNDDVALNVIIAALLLGWPWLASFCMKKRRVTRPREFRRRVIQGLLLLPVAATAVMFYLVHGTSGVNAAILTSIMGMIAAFMACLGGFVALLKWTFD